MGEPVAATVLLDQSGRPDVLVADDDEDVRELIVLLFEDAGYAVLTAADGVSTLALLRSHPTPLIVLLDWWMPAPDGITVLESIAADEPLLGAQAQRHVFFLFTVRHEEARPLLAALPKHLSVTLVGKPVDIDHLRALIDGAAEQLRSGSQHREPTHRDDDKTEG
jgi:CheY-like chemotaxis protein